jgi:glutamate synthase domain-containing protein 2
MGGEVRIYDVNKAKELKDKGFILHPDPDEVDEIPIQGFERHSVPGAVEPNLKDLESKVKILREIGYKKVFFKTGSYMEPDLEATLLFAKKMDLNCVTFDGKPGGTGMSPKEIMENVGIGSLHCLIIGYSILQKMEGKKPSFIIAGGMSRPEHAIKAILLGADGVGMASSMCAAAMYLGYQGIKNYITALIISSKQILSTLKEYTLEPIKGKAKTFLMPLTKEVAEITGLPLMDSHYIPNYD